MESHGFRWRGLDIEVLFEPDYTPVFREIYGHALGHLQVRCLNGKPLRFSETGYKSHFERTDNVLVAGGPADYVREWLDYAAHKNRRQSQQPDDRQLLLF
jgi:hypothetical protein